MRKISKQEIIKIIGEATDKRFSADQIEDDMSLTDLGLDSLTQLELVMAFEEEMEIQITDDEADKYFTYASTIGQITAYLDGRTE